MLLSRTVPAEPPWQHPLSYDGGGYWTLRVPIEMVNSGNSPIDGTPVRILLSKGTESEPLIGCPVAGLRAVNASREELLYAIVDSAGQSKRTGALAEGDRIILPAEVPANGSAQSCLYADNAAAWPVVDWLATGLANGGFEQEEAMPVQWSESCTDATHRMSLSREDTKSGAACARCDVAPGALPAWVNYSQQGIHVEPGQKYRFIGWVKGKEVLGQAGWYVHVDGQQPLLVNSIAAWDGSYDWRQAEIEFVVPEGGRTFSCGTVLHGTGTAWYDDAALELLDDNPSLQAKVLPAETMQLQVTDTDTAWPSDTNWAWRAPVRVRNFTDKPSDKALVTCDIRRFRNGLAKILGFQSAPATMLAGPDTTNQMVPVTDITVGEFNVTTSIPPKTEKTLWLYASKKAPTAASGRILSATEWVNSPLNLLSNGDMEQGGNGAPAAWLSGKETRPEDHSFEAMRVEGGVSGAWCLKLQVPQGPGEPGWVGWRQTVPVKPFTQYVLSGYIKTQSLDGDATIYVHVLRADGSTIESLNLGAAPLVRGDKDWTRVETAIATPGDCGSLEVHLTTNRRGTLWYDAVMLAETRDCVVGPIEAREKSGGPSAWPVSTLAKVFQDDLPPETPSTKGVQIHAARNAWESFQVAVRTPADETRTICVTPLHGPDGRVLDPPVLYRVGYVPIDFPIGYHNTTAPPYRRFLPASRGNDGWPGWWPDPLERLPVEHTPQGMTASLSLRKERTQPLWFDLQVPIDAVPGTYTGEIILDGTSLPIDLTVWDFAMPGEKHLPALYDLRSGPLGDILAGPNRTETLQMWQRLLARFNVSPSMVLNEPVFGYEDGHVTMQTQDFDKEARYLLDELHVNKVYAPQLFYACGWAYAPKDVFGLKAFTPEYVSAWQEAYRLFVEHVTEKGWRNRFVFYIADEPFAKSGPTISGIARLADMAREIAPDIPVYSSTWTDIQGLEGHLTQWGVGVHGSFPVDRIEARRAAGDRFWFTTDGHMCTDTPLLAIERLLPWFCFRYGVDGYEFWGVSWWSQDPWQSGWHQYISQSDEGQKYYHVRYPNGDGFLTYPPRGAGGEPAPTIRLMAARAGVDDYEIFLALRAHADAGDPDARAALEKVQSLTPGIPNEGGRFSTLLMHDPYAIQEARRAAGETLTALVRRDKTSR